jgi:hypothetical protein
MSEDALSILRVHDDPIFQMFPKGFDMGLLREKIKKLRQLLTEEFGFEPRLECGPPMVQDATYFAELALIPRIERVNYATIRISNFDPLATIINEGALDETRASRVRHFVKAAGFTYIPEDILEQPYSGNVEHVDTWMHRFFDYL